MSESGLKRKRLATLEDTDSSDSELERPAKVTSTINRLPTNEPNFTFPKRKPIKVIVKSEIDTLCDRLKTDLARLESEIKSKKAEAKTFQAEKQEAAKEINALKREKQELEAKNAELRKENDRYEKIAKIAVHFSTAFGGGGGRGIKDTIQGIQDSLWVGNNALKKLEDAMKKDPFFDTNDEITDLE